VLDHIAGHGLEFVRLSRGYPRKTETIGFETNTFQHLVHDNEFTASVVVSRDIVAIAGMAATNPDSICASFEGFKDEFWV
jgi:hypothetical protein